jgi:hypothetical protein
MNNLYLVIAPLLLSLACASDSIEKPDATNAKLDTTHIDSVIIESQPEVPQQPDIDSLMVFGDLDPIRFDEDIRGIGLIVLKESISYMSNTRPDTIRIVDPDGNIIAFSFLHDDFHVGDSVYSFTNSNEKWINERIGLLYGVVYPEHSGLYAPIKRIQGDRYYIFDREGRDRYMTLTKTIEFITWEERVMRSLITINPDVSPLRTSPNDSAGSVTPFNNFVLKAVEMRGDWIRVICDSNCSSCYSTNITGWLRWRRGEKLLISLGSLC